MDPELIFIVTLSLLGLIVALATFIFVKSMQKTTSAQIAKLGEIEDFLNKLTQRELDALDSEEESDH